MSGRTTPPEESLTFRNGAAPLTVEFYENRIEARSHPAKTVRLPATGTSSEVVFPVQVGPDEERLHCTVRVYHHRRLLQNLELSGPVATEDRRVGEDEISLAGDAFRSLVSSPQRGLHKRSTSIVINRSDEACFRGKGDARGARDHCRARHRAARDQLDAAMSSDEIEDARPGSEQQVQLLQGLAQQGTALLADFPPWPRVYAPSSPAGGMRGWWQSCMTGYARPSAQ